MSKKQHSIALSTLLVDISFVPGIYALLLLYSLTSIQLRILEINIFDITSLKTFIVHGILPGLLLASIIVLISEMWVYFSVNKGFFLPTFSQSIYILLKGFLITITTVIILSLNIIFLSYLSCYDFFQRYIPLFTGIEVLLFLVIIYIQMRKELKTVYSYTVPVLSYQNIGFVEISVLGGLTLLSLTTSDFSIIYLPIQFMKYSMFFNYFTILFVLILYVFIVYAPLFLDVYDISKKHRLKLQVSINKRESSFNILDYIPVAIMLLLSVPLIGLLAMVISVQIFKIPVNESICPGILASLLFIFLFYKFEAKHQFRSSWSFQRMSSMLIILLSIFIPIGLIDLVFLSSLPSLRLVFLCYRNIYDILNVRLVIASLIYLRLIIAFLMLLVVLLFVYLFYKRNLIIHFIYFLLDKGIVFGLVPAILLILSLILFMPIYSYVDLYNNYGYAIFRLNSSPEIIYYDLSKISSFANTIFEEYEFCSNNTASVFPFTKLPPPSLYGAFIPMGLFIAIISSLIMFIGNMYKINKHFDAYVREYIGRYVDKSITQLRPIHRIFIAGYGMLGKKLTYTILQHQLVDPEMLGLEKKERHYDIVLLPFTDIGDLLKYEVVINNLCIITLESEDLAINIDHPVLGKIGLIDVKYSAGERVYIPIVLNDVSLNSILRYLKLVEPPPQKSFNYPVYVFMLIPFDRARSKAMYNLLDKTINSDATNQVLLLMRARKSAEIIRIDARILDGRLCFLYPEYLIGYIIGREIL